MSKPIKELVRNELVKRFQGVTSLAVVGFTGLDAIATHSVRGRLQAKDIRMTVVKNSIARQAFKSLGLEAASDSLEGPCAVAYGSDSVVTVVRTLLEVGKDAPNLKVKAALLDGVIFGADRIEELSKFPTRDEAISRVVTCVLSSGSRLSACLVGPGSAIASILKTVQDKAKDAEAAAAAAAPAPAPAEAPAAAAAAAPAPAAAPEAAAPAAAPEAKPEAPAEPKA